MAVEMVDVYNQQTGQKTRLPRTALAHPKWSDQFTETPKGRATSEKKGA